MKPRERSVTARDITRPAMGGVPKKIIDAAWKYARILGTPMIPKIAIRNNLASKWLGRCQLRWHSSLGRQENLMEIQKRAMFDERTLDRVVAHEMAHHAEFLEVPLDQIALIRAGIKISLPSHGARWQHFADKINRVMGADYVTVVSDASHLIAPETKPYILMIVKSSALGQYAYAIGMKMTPKMRLYLHQYMTRGARIIESRDPRWARGPKISSGYLSTPKEPEDYQKLERLYAEAVPFS